MASKASRRQFLKSLASASASVPLALGGMSMSSLAKAAGEAKMKLVFAVIPDGFGVDPYGGYNNGLWFPNTNSKDTTNFQLNEMSRHLGNHANQALFLKGTLLASGTGGHNAWKYILRDSAGSKTSVDILLGNHMPGANASIKRLYSGPHATVGASWNISYQNNSMILPETSPYKLFEQVYGNYQAPASSGGNTNSRTHLFDPINGQIQNLRAQLGGSERAKLDTHLDSVEQVVTDLRSSVPSAGECDPSSAEPYSGLVTNSAEYRTEVTQAHAKIISSALSCGSTRVATMQIGRSADQVIIKSVSTTRNPHDCAHRYGSVNEWKESRAWYTKQVKYLLDQLAAYPDPDVPSDSLLDHTLVVFTSEMADGAPEHMQDVPVTLIGGASGRLMNGNGSGRFYDIQDYGDRSHWKLGKAVDMQRVWATIAQAAGTSLPYGGNVSTIPNIFTNV